MLGELGIFFRTKDDLGQPLAIAQIDENNAAMIAAHMHPARELGGAADVRRAQLIAMMGAIHVAGEQASGWR